MTTLRARYNAIGFTGLNGANTFVTLATPTGEIRAFLTTEALKTLFTSHNIRKTFSVTLTDLTQNGWHQEAKMVDATLLVTADA